jgi:hypothetical protein
MQDKSRRILALCSRRAGKTYAMATILMATALAQPGSNSLYLGLTRAAAKKTMWTEIWIPLCAKWGAVCTHNASELTTTFANGSHVYFAGTDDERHIETNLGFKLALAIIDECQSQTRAILKRLVEGILPPALSDAGGRMIMAGTIPEAPAGYFWEQWQSKRWSMHNWSLFENPHFKNPHEELAAHLAVSGLAPDDPLILRDWWGRIVFDATALAYRYDKDRNGFAVGSEERDPLGKWVKRIAPAEIIKLCDSFSVGGDQGAVDRNVIQVTGWSSKHRDVYQVYEWATIRSHQGAWSGFGPQLDQIRRLFDPDRHFFDFGGSKLTLDNFTTDFGVYVLHAAKKGDRKGQVDRLNDLLLTGRYHAMIGSHLEGDFLKTQWDRQARERGAWEWSSHNHPDAADAARYSVQGYFDAYEPPPPPQPEEARGFEDDETAGKVPWFEDDMQQLLPDGPSELY